MDKTPKKTEKIYSFNYSRTTILEAEETKDTHVKDWENILLIY